MLRTFNVHACMHAQQQAQSSSQLRVYALSVCFCLVFFVRFRMIEFPFTRTMIWILQMLSWRVKERDRERKLLLLGKHHNKCISTTTTTATTTTMVMMMSKTKLVDWSIRLKYTIYARIHTVDYMSTIWKGKMIIKPLENKMKKKNVYICIYVHGVNSTHNEAPPIPRA